MYFKSELVCMPLPVPGWLMSIFLTELGIAAPALHHQPTKSRLIIILKAKTLLTSILFYFILFIKF